MTIAEFIIKLQELQANERDMGEIVHFYGIPITDVKATGLGARLETLLEVREISTITKGASSTKILIVAQQFLLTSFGS